MDRVEMVVLTAEARGQTHDALSELKRLGRAGWIDLTYYAVVDKDASGAVHVQESSDPVETASVSAAEGLSGVLAGCLLGPAGATLGAATGVMLGRWTATAESHPYVPAAGPDNVQDALPAGHSVLMVVVEERYVERVVEEMEARGKTFRRALARAEREAALRASIDRIKTNVRWLEELLANELRKVERVPPAEKEKVEATIAAARAELGSERENLQARLRALGSELDEELQETRLRIGKDTGAARKAVDRRIGILESSLADCNEDLALSILDHMDTLAAHALDLQSKAARASADAAKALEGQLHELEVRMRRHRAELTATLGSSAARARQCLDHLRMEAAQGKEDLTPALDRHMKEVEARHATLKADLRRLEKEDTRAWHEFAAGFRKSWRALSESVDQAKCEDY